MAQTRVYLAMAAALLILAGCQTQGQILAGEQDVAIQTAVSRGQFELDCQEATGTVLSSNLLQPIVWSGQERAQYTVGVSGCDKRAVYVVICPLDSSGCFAGSGRDNPEIAP
jgi:hypothetical protein